MQWIPFSITVSTSRCNNSLSNLHSWRPKSREVKKIVGESVIYCYSRLHTSCLDRHQKLSKFESGEPQSDVRKAMTHLYYGYVKLIRVCQTYMGMSHLYGSKEVRSKWLGMNSGQIAWSRAATNNRWDKSEGPKTGATVFLLRWTLAFLSSLLLWQTNIKK